MSLSSASNVYIPKQYSTPELLQILIVFRTQYIDILPENILQPGDTDYEFHKCRTNFFHRVRGVIAILIKRNELATDDESISTFLHYMGSDRDWHAKSTVADINFVNKILDHVISILNSSKSEES